MALQSWSDGPTGGTPLSAENLNEMTDEINASVKRWRGSTQYAAGERVVSPAGDIVTALLNHFSGTSYSESSWGLSPTFEPHLPEGGSTTRFLRGDRTWQTINTGGGTEGDAAGFPVEVLMDPSVVSGPVGTKVKVPTPQNATDGQLTHPSVLFFPDGWSGYKYWMAMTPYPAGNDDHEDPCIVVSQDGINWIVPPGLTNPIDDADGQPEYNSDVDLKMGPNGMMYLFWRFYDPSAVGQEENMFYSTSTDGVDWSAKVRFRQYNKNTLSLVSPSFVFEDNRWIMFAVDLVPSPNRVVRVESSSVDPEGAWSDPITITTGAPTAGKEPWHLYVLKFGGRYYMLRADCTVDANGSAPNLQFQVSADGVTFVGAGKQVIPMSQSGKHDQLYRSTMVPAIQDGVFGFRVWYSGWTTSPQEWWLFRTFISVAKDTGPRMASGTTMFDPQSVPATTGFKTVAVSFPTGRFTTPPIVVPGSDSGRLNVAATSITKDGFTFTANNWTSGTSTPKLFWIAMEAL